jgi:hypothetical protein
MSINLRKSTLRMPLLLSVLAGSAVLTGCTSALAVKNKNIDIHTEDSLTARVSQVELKEDTEGLMVTGTLQRSAIGRGLILGHLHIEVSGRDGALLQDLEIDQMYPGNNRQFEPFQAHLKPSVQQISAIKVVHHDSWSKEHPDQEEG